MGNMAKKVRLHGVFYTEKVRAASTANATIATLDAGQALDGVTLAAGDLVLLKDQTTAAENGVYRINADTVAASRAPGWETGTSVVGYAARVYEGTVNAGRVYAVYAEPAVIGTNDPEFIRHERNGA